MSLQSLTPPQDITWTRMAYSKDMIDTSLNDLMFPPKWRTSLAVYFYIIPEEDTADAYPDSRIVYLKLTSSITGWNPSESLIGAHATAEESGDLDDIQKSIWQTIVASGWASKYWPCLGAIMQIAVYPNNHAEVDADDYPYIMDFEPKKRELFESVQEGGEILEGSSERISTLKGSTTTKSVSASAGASFLGIGASVGLGYSKETVDNRTTDTNREARETENRSSTFSQMYQLFNGYHLGTNRGLFVIAPRPHTVSTSEQTEFNLINGQRKLEGVQEVFLVVHLPKMHKGFCIQASIDTGHLAATSTPRYLTRMRRDEIDHLPTDPIVGGGDDGDDGDDEDVTTPTQQIIITRRVVQSCGTFDANGNFSITKNPAKPNENIIGEFTTPDLLANVVRNRVTGETNKRARIEIANSLNVSQRQVTRSLLDKVSGGNYKPRKFIQTDVFKSLVALSSRKMEMSLVQLVSKNYINRKTADILIKHKITTVSDLFKDISLRIEDVDMNMIRTGIIEKMLK